MAESVVPNLEVDGAHLIEHGDICEMCENTASVGYCSECECYLCQLCFDNHIKIKKNNHHILQIAPEGKEDDRTIHFKTCREHTQQEVRLYCTDHKCVGCGECMAFNHKSCKYKYITEASKEFQDSGELGRFLDNIQDLENIHENCVQLIALQSELSDNIDKTTTSDVQQFVKDVVSYVSDEEKRIIKNAGSKKSLNDDKIEKLSDDLHTIGSDITSINTSVKSEEKIHKLFILAMQAKPKLSQIRDTLESIDCQGVIDRYTFYPNRLIQRQFSEKRPLGKLSDTQSEEDDEEDYERKYKAQCLDIQLFKEQLSIQEENSNRLEQKLSTQQEENQRLKLQSATQEQQHKQKLSTQEQEIQGFKQQLSTKQQDNKGLQKQLSTQEQQLKQQLSTQEQQFKLQVSTQEQQFKQQLSTQEQQFKQQASTQQQEIQRFKQQLSSEQQDNKRLQQQLSTQEQQFKQQASTQQQEIQRFKQQLSSEQQDNKRLQQQLSTQEHEFKQQLSTKTQENQRLNQQLLTQQQDITRLQQQMSTQQQGLRQLNQCKLACGHVCDVGQMSTNRTIRCPMCGIIFGDQPDGTLRTESQGACSELKFQFSIGMQSNLNLNPGKPYEGNEVTGYVYNGEDGPIIQKMLKLAFDRQLLFTVNTHGQIVTNGIDIFIDKPPPFVTEMTLVWLLGIISVSFIMFVVIWMNSSLGPAPKAIIMNNLTNHIESVWWNIAI